jgi:hypothetical protein
MIDGFWRPIIATFYLNVTLYGVFHVILLKLDFKGKIIEVGLLGYLAEITSVHFLGKTSLL